MLSESYGVFGGGCDGGVPAPAGGAGVGGDGAGAADSAGALPLEPSFRLLPLPFAFAMAAPHLEVVERCFAHVYDTGGLRRTHLRGHPNILKRLLIHAGGFN